MPVYKFRIAWEEDDNIFRDIELTTGQTFFQFHEAILLSFDMKTKGDASFFESNDKWIRRREISAQVLVNKKDAPALAMIKTPVSALVDNPDKKFIYTVSDKREWIFLISLIGIEREERHKQTYPACVRSEGLPPAQTFIKDVAQDKMMEIEEKYDLQRDNMEEQGFADEGDDDDFSDTDDGGNEDD